MPPAFGIFPLQIKVLNSASSSHATKRFHSTSAKDDQEAADEGPYEEEGDEENDEDHEDYVENRGEEDEHEDEDEDKEA